MSQKTDKKNNKYLYMPLEIFSRELNGMLLFSLLAANKGWQVIIGGKQHLFPYLKVLPEGICLLKSIVPGETELQKKFKSFGHKIVSLDAEGLIPSNGVSGVTVRYSEESIKESDLLFFWGKEQFDQVQSVFSSIKRNGFITGSPVFDYWRYLKVKNDSSTKDDEKRILIATSFPLVNHFASPSTAWKASLNAMGKDAIKEHVDELSLDGKLQEAVYPKFKELVEHIAKKYTDHKIILRPHPVEDTKVWKEIADSYDNVELQVGGQISKWLLECDMFLHFNSTTSIEASFFGKKVITYFPEVNNSIKSRLSQYVLDVSQVCRTYDEVDDCISSFNQGEEYGAKLCLSNIIETSNSNDIAACSKNILDELDKLPATNSDIRSFPGSFKLYLNIDANMIILKRRILWFLGWVDYYANIFSGKYCMSKDYYKHLKVKQGIPDFKELDKKINSLCDALSLERNQLSFENLKQGIFLINKL